MGGLALGHLDLWEEGPLALSEEEAARRIRRSLFFLGLHREVVGTGLLARLL